MIQHSDFSITSAGGAQDEPPNCAEIDRPEDSLWNKISPPPRGRGKGEGGEGLLAYQLPKLLQDLLFGLFGEVGSNEHAAPGMNKSPVFQGW